MNTSEDESLIDVQQLLRLGMTLYEKKDYKKARACWFKIKFEHGKGIYSVAQYLIGNSFLAEDNIEQTQEHWKKVEESHDAYVYIVTQYSLACLYWFMNNEQEAELYCNNFINCKGLFQTENYFYELGIYNQQRIAICLRENGSAINKNKIEAFALPLQRIQQQVAKIQEYLHINPINLDDKERYFAHYTRVEIAEKIIKNGSFHLGIANYMNDPTEGKILFKEWNIPLDYNDNLMAFLTSFTFNENSLNQFRLYGKQDGKDGSGLSLVVNSQFFDSILDFDKNLNSNMELLTGNVVENLNELNIKKKKMPEKLQLFRCIYMKPETNYISIAHRSKLSFFLDSTLEDPETVWQDYLKKMNEITGAVKTLLSNIKNNIDDIQKSIQDLKISKPDEIYKALSTTLLPIIYLTKHAAFEEEAECRVLYVTSVLDDEIQWEDDRVYVEYKTQLADQYQQDGQSQNYLERIYLGPKADPRAELNLKKCWIDKMRKKEMANNEIKIPTIIKSDMPLA